MGLAEQIAAVERDRRTLTVYGDDAAAADLRERFASRNLRVETGTATGDPGAFAVLSDDGRVLTAIDLAELSDADTVGEAFGDLVSHLDGTLFSSYDTRRLTATSREIEDRAWRVSAGTLHAGFQDVAALEAQRDTYRDLASRELSVHAYVRPFEEGSVPRGVTVHESDSEEIRRTWFVVFDGGGDDAHKCALLAEQRDGDDADRFYGFWTYDPAEVDAALDHLERTYLDRASPDERGT